MSSDEEGDTNSWRLRGSVPSDTGEESVMHFPRWSMSNAQRGLLMLTLLAAVVALPTTVPAANPSKTQYAVTQIGNLNVDPIQNPILCGGGSLCPQGSGAYGMNSHGDVVGWSYYTWDGSVFAVLFVYHDGQLTNLGALGGWSSYGYAISDSGIVVGTAAARAAYFPFYPFIWQDGVMSSPFGAIPSCDLSVSTNLFNCNGIAVDINSHGDIVGRRFVANSVTDQAYLYSGGSFTDLGNLSGETTGTATAINDRGDIVGTSGLRLSGAGCCGGDLVTREGGGRAFLYSGGEMHDLGSLGGPLSGANDISGNGKIVGFSDTANGERHAFVSSRGGAMRDLGTLGGTFSEATAINRSGTVIVGDSTTPSGELHGFVYANGRMVDLTELVVPAGAGPVIDAQDVNDAGQIAGRMVVDNRSPFTAQAVLLTPLGTG